MKNVLAVGKAAGMMTKKSWMTAEEIQERTQSMLQKYKDNRAEF